MYKITTSAHFDSAHFLSGYDGKCRNIHGHRWTVEADFSADILSNSGMVIDFKEAKSALKLLADAHDHTFLYEAGTLSPTLETALRAEGFSLTVLSFRPTAENFAAYFYTLLQEKTLPVTRVTVYETPENAATYEEGTQ